MTKTYVERTLETLVDFAAIHRDQMQAMTQHFDEALQRVTASIDALTIQVVQMNAGVKQNSQNIEKLTQAIERNTERVTQAIDRNTERVTQAIDRQIEAINGHLRVAEQQERTAQQNAANISDLTKLVTMQAATINTLMERLAS
ncbi:MAG: hypothetical protein HC866_17850 [Leptolyngbyaceae cyanobacterium RU_5_1]|nr:hypothetical protein [Leptolyngbyaceae cyanobacterium RU_5_1]